MAPGHGNLGAIVSWLKSQKQWPVSAKWRVSLYSGSFNSRGMQEADIEALGDIMRHSDEPLMNLSKFPFFGRQSCHPVTDSLGSFALP